MSSWSWFAAALPILTGLESQVAAEVRQLELRQVRAPVDRVHDLQRAGLVGMVLALAGPLLEPVHERAGLLGEAEPQERVQREGRVADPRVAVVPVARAADRLGQARRGGRDDGARRLVGQQLQRQRRARDHLAPATPVLRLRDPAPPELDRLRELRGRLARPDDAPDRGALGHPLEHERDALARVQGELRAHAHADLLERDRSRERQREARRLEERSAIAELERVLRPSVVEGRLALEAHVHRAAHAQHAADQTMAVPLARGRLDRHEVLHLADPVGIERARDQDVRVREVQLLRPRAGVGGSDAVVPTAVGVEDRGEDARRVEARAAVPVDRPVRGDERDRVQVADDAVFLDRRIPLAPVLVGHLLGLRLRAPKRHRCM